MQIWVLTGDRLETAVTVSYSAGHFEGGSHPVSVVQQTTSQHCEDALKRINCWYINYSVIIMSINFTLKVK